MMRRKERALLEQHAELIKDYKDMVEIFKEAWEDTNAMNVLLRESNHRLIDRLIDQALATLDAPKSEEWVLLHTLCSVLESHGTEFESGSLLAEWWGKNKEPDADEGTRG
jgi:type I site-specific restriction-modification system R (restriction) subunit